MAQDTDAGVGGVAACCCLLPAAWLPMVSGLRLTPGAQRDVHGLLPSRRE